PATMMQSGPWLVSNPRAACQEGAPVCTRRDHVHARRTLSGDLRVCSKGVDLETHFCRHCCQRALDASEPPPKFADLNLNGAHFVNVQLDIFITKEFVRLN